MGWPPEDGYKLRGRTKAPKSGWAKVRSVLEEMQVGDLIVVHLKGHRIGRLGEVVRKEVEDDEWKPLVPPSRHLPHGEMGRRVLVRWDLERGPVDPELVVSLPEAARLGGYLRATLLQINQTLYSRVAKAAANRENWVGLLGHKFCKETSLSDYIAAYPHRLEDGLTPFPDAKTREQVFDDATRSDVLLLDADNNPVVVECKQNPVQLSDLTQLRRYVQNVKKETGRTARGVLIHGGALKLSDAIKREADKTPRVEIVSYRLDVDFSPCM